ncbi:hypothetical protein GCM10027018_28640 [Paenibacillus thermoaerophilus]
MATLFPIPAANAAYNLVWSDEFNGSTIDTNNWVYEIGTGSGGWGNNELQYYTSRPENARIENGNLGHRSPERILRRHELYIGPLEDPREEKL